MEKTFAMIKPDAVQRGLTGEILKRYEQKGLRIAGMKIMNVTEELARKHYAEHVNKPFFPGLLEYITSGPVVALVLEGKNAVAEVRKMNGATNPLEAACGTIRGDFAQEVAAMWCMVPTVWKALPMKLLSTLRLKKYWTMTICPIPGCMNKQ